MIAATTLLLSLALSAYAAPSKRQSEDNGSCQALQTECASSVKSDLSDAWNIKACVFGASCFGGQHPVDGFLAAVWADRGESGSAPTSVSLPRVTSSVSTASCSSMLGVLTCSHSFSTLSRRTERQLASKTSSTATTRKSLSHLSSPAALKSYVPHQVS